MNAPPDAGGLMGSAAWVIDELDERRAMASVAAGLLGRSIPAVQIDRFVLLERVGSGGMGTVYAAFDPQLDRKIAIKLLHPGDDGAVDDAALLREARAVAQLNHRNVVTIHEVGTCDGRPYLAMELVEGQPLSTWSATSHPWRETVQVLASAGDGLAAAHAVGVVHRDFKPSNVVLGGDGRVIVLDFGLASNDSAVSAGGSDGETCPRIGTPAYMAPEQHDGDPATAASDQFSFCVSLYEALYGQLPFATRSALQLRADIAEARLAPLKSARTIPLGLRRAILRGLQAEPAARWSSIEALVAALRGILSRSWKRAAGPALGLSVVGIAGWFSWSLQPPSCATLAKAELESVWTGQSGDRVHAALSAVDSSPVVGVADRVTKSLGEFAEAWESAREKTCEADRAAPSRRGRSAQAQCLQQQRDGFGAALELLVAANRQVLLDADRIAPEIDAIQACDAALSTDTPGAEPTANARERTARLAEAEVLMRAGHDPEAHAHAEAVRQSADADGDLAGRARANRLLGQLASRAENRPEAVESFQAAVVDAERAGDTVARLDALRALASELILTASYDEAQRLLDQAAAAHDRFDPLPWAWDAHLVRLRAQLAIERGALDDAEQLAQHNLALVIEHRADEPDRVLAARMLLAEVATKRVPNGGDGAEARRRWAQVREQAEAAYGPVHETIAVVESSTSVIHYRRGEQDLAEAAIRRSIAITEQLRGPEHASLARRLINLAVIIVPRKPKDAAAILERAVAIARADGATSRRLLASGLFNLSGVNKAQGEYDTATRHLREALEIYTELRGPEHRRTVIVMNDLAETLLRVDRRAEALELFERAYAIERSERGAGSPLLVAIMLGRVKALDYLGRADEALPLALQAAELARTTPISPQQKLSINNSLIMLLLDKRDPESVRRARVALQDAQAAADHPSVSDGAREAVVKRAAELRDAEGSR